MKRTDLTLNLKQVEPAVSTRDIIAIFSAFCFDGTSVTAYDDIVAMQCPCSFNIKGGIKGRLLLPWITASKATEVDATQDGDTVTIKAGRSELKAAVFPASEFIFKFPDPTGAAVIPLKEDVVKGLKTAMLSIGHDPGHPWRLGITVHFGKKSIILYSTDDKTATRVKLPFQPNEEMVGRMTILPPKFCQLLVNAAVKDPAKEMILTEEWVEVKFTSGLRLFSRTISGVAVENFQKVFTQVETEDLVTVPVPKGIERALQRAFVLIPFCAKPFTSLTVTEGKLHFKTDSGSGAGIATDTIGFEGHGDVTLNVTPDLMTRALEYSEKMAIVANTCVLYKNAATGFIHLVSPILDQ